VLEREDEIGCAVGGCNFLLRTITHEAFAFEAGQAQFVPCSCECLGCDGSYVSNVEDVTTPPTCARSACPVDSPVCQVEYRRVPGLHVQLTSPHSPFCESPGTQHQAALLVVYV
jgi:hypothetical protein